MLSVECRCGAVLARRSTDTKCERCYIVPKVLARVVLGKGGSVPDPALWVDL